MKKLITLTVACVGLGAGIAGVAACGDTASSSPAKDLIAIQVGATRSSAPPAPQPAQTPGDIPVAGVATSPAASTAPATTSPTPDASPTVAKTQKWVKIFSGPGQGVNAPTVLKGSHTVELNATESAEIGTYVSDGSGRTLYVFAKDTKNTSNCNGSCATAWPPLLIKSPGKIFPDGVDPKRISYIERADGHCQVAIDGHPLYYFVADSKAGDINGQGVNGTWFAVAPDGGKTSATPVFPSPTN